MGCQIVKLSEWLGKHFQDILGAQQWVEIIPCRVKNSWNLILPGRHQDISWESILICSEFQARWTSIRCICLLRALPPQKLSWGNNFSPISVSLGETQGDIVIHGSFEDSLSCWLLIIANFLKETEEINFLYKLIYSWPPLRRCPESLPLTNAHGRLFSDKNLPFKHRKFMDKHQGPPPKLAINLEISWEKQIKVSYFLSHVQLFATPWTGAHQAPLPIGFPRQGYWSGLPFPSPGDLSTPGIKPGLCIASGFFTIWATREACEH